MSGNINTGSKVPEKPNVLRARDPSSAHELAETHPNVHVVPLIADDEASVKRAIKAVKKVTKRLDIVVANAGE
ncbi:hypothetical protein QFC24_004853 [Naganishia onofrii]|uniref:Uncharacterized protein n=1 Tax=Naganishia onofrii TaxID=1851511 RepID=A0ACC2XAY0_9TREE|nr:hypothetical protein QFC24_004853 [Naganishia onofrii]